MTRHPVLTFAAAVFAVWLLGMATLVAGACYAERVADQVQGRRS